MTRARSVLHVTTTATSLELLLGPQLCAFREAGWEVATASASGFEVETLRRWGIDHVPLRHATRAMAPHRDAAAFLELVHLFRRRRPDIVHTHNPKPGVYGRLAARAAGVPGIVNTVHGLYAQPSDPWRRRAVVYSLEAVASRASHVELVQNVEDLPVLRRLGVPEAKLVLLGNGVDLTRFDPGLVPAAAVAALRRHLDAGPDSIVVCVVGRLVREKGFVEVLEAAKQLSTRNRRVRWVVVGAPDSAKPDALGDQDVRRAERRGVRFLGFRDDMPLVYAASDVFVSASHREGFPRAAMEAAAMGLPIIATDVRGNRQVVEPEVNGRLVPPRAPHALAAAVDDVAAMSTARRRSWGDAGRLKALKEFDDRRLVSLTLDVYDTLLHREAAWRPW